MSTDARPPEARTGAARYAVGMFGTSLPINMVNSQMMFFYVDHRGVDARIYAGVMVVYFIIDMFDNPFYGWLSDRTRSKWGRRRPWIVVGAPLLCVSFILLFNPVTQLTGAALVAWFALWAVLTQTFDSAVNAAYGAVLPESFPDERHRALANGMRQGCQLLAMILSLGLVPMLADKFGYGPVALVFGVVAVTVIVYSGTGVREDMSGLEEVQTPLWTSLKAIVRNPMFYAIATASALYTAGMMLVIAAVSFYVKYALGGDPSQATLLMVSVIVTSLLTLALWTWLVRRYDALPIWRIALGFLALALFGLTQAHTLAVAISVGVIVGVGYSGVMATVDLIIAKLLDQDVARTGVHREGMFLAAFGFFNRVTGLVQAFTAMLMFAIYGYRSGDDPGPRPGDASKFMIGWMPFALLAIAFGVSLLVRFRRPAPAD